MTHKKLIDDNGCCVECGHPANNNSGGGICDSLAHGVRIGERVCGGDGDDYDEGNGYRKIVMIAAREGWKTRLGTPWSKTQVRKAVRASHANYPTVSDRAEPYQIELPRRTQQRLRKSQYRRGTDSRRKPGKPRKRKR